MRMRSPFPGMDPWLEGHWGDVHHRLITHFANQIQQQLPEELFASIEITLYITADGDDRGRVLPDVSVLHPEREWRPEPLQQPGGVAVAVPYRMRRLWEPKELGHIEIRSVADESQLITAIEVLSPANKIGRRGRGVYVDKREEYYNAGANVVEVDLLRGGAELIDVAFDEVPDQLRTAYKAVVYRSSAKDGSDTEYYAIPLREKLPAIAVPLRKRDANVVLNFQDAIDEVYERGRYGGRLNYNRPPVPSLDEADRAWAAEMITKNQ